MSENKNMNIEKDLKAYLKENEKVCWQGKTETFPLMDKHVKNQLLGRWICTAVVAIGLIFLYVRVMDAEMLDMKLILGIAAVAVFIMLMPVFEWYRLSRQNYWLTNQRAIVMKFDGSFCSLNLTEIDEVLVLKDKADYDCLVLGSGALKDVEKNLRWRACNPKADKSISDEDEGRDSRGMIFYCVSNAEAAAILLKQGMVA